MQQKETRKQFNKVLGQLFRDIRKSNGNISISKFSHEYDFDRGNMSKLERGIICCNMFTAYKMCEAYNIDFSDFAVRLKEKLGKDFSTIDN